MGHISIPNLPLCLEIHRDVISIEYVNESKPALGIFSPHAAKNHFPDATYLLNTQNGVSRIAFTLPQLAAV